MKKFARAVGFVAVGFLAYNVFSSFMLDFQDINVESLRQRFSEVNFVGPGNDFGGAIFRLDAKNLSTGFILEHSTGATYEKKSCMTQVRGIYYNNQRGLRLWPLDSASLSMLRSSSATYNNLQMTGGFFRDCTTLSGGAGTSTGEIYSIYGYIQYTLSGSSTSIKSYIAAGTKLNFAANKMSTGLANNFQYFNNTTPLGYIYDSNGGIGFIGGDLSGHNNLITFLNSGDNAINDAFTISGISIVSTSGSWSFISISGIDTAQDTLWKLLIQGTIGLSKSITSQERLSLLGNPEKRTVIYGGTEINSSTILNLARKNAQNLCRGKTWLTNITLLPTTSDTILCIQNSTGLVISLASEGPKYQNKTLIVSSGNVILKGSMQNGDGPTEIFIDRGNLLAYNSIPSAQLVNFNIDGFPASSNAVNSGMYLKGNFIVYGLIIGTNSLTNPVGNLTGFDHKLHLEGKVVSLNSPTEPSAGRINQVNALFGTSAFANRINLENTFIRACSFAGVGSDGTPCGTGGITSLVPFVILNGNFPGNLLQ